MDKRIEYALVAVLLLSLIVQSLIGINYNSATYDELDHITSGYSKLITGDFRLYTESPPFADMLFGVPLLFMDLEFPFDHPAWNIKNQNLLSEQFFFVYNGDKFEQMLFAARMMALVMSLVAAIVLFIWSKELFGTKAALFTLFIYSFEPQIIAQSGLTIVDLPLMLFALLTFYFFWRYYKDPSIKNILLTSTFLGLAQVTKFSAIFLFPIIGLFLLILTLSKKYELNVDGKLLNLFRDIRSSYLKKTAYFAASLFIMGLISFTIISSSYLFGGIGKPIKESMYDDVHLNKNTYKFIFDELEKQPLKILSEAPSPLPYYYVKGFAFNVFEEKAKVPSGGKILSLRQSAETKPFGLLYTVMSFLLKEPLPLIILLTIFISLNYNNLFKRDWLFFIIPIVFYFAWFATSTRGGGIRYVLPAFPLIFMLAGKTFGDLWTSASKLRWTRILSLALVVWYALSSASIAPNYIAYFNGIVSTEEAYKYFSDTNLDFGQEMDELVQFLKSNGIRDIRINSVIWLDEAYLERNGITYRLYGCEESADEGMSMVMKLTTLRDCDKALIENLQDPIRVGQTYLVNT